MKSNKVLTTCILALSLAPGSLALAAENYPQRPIRLVVAFPPGGPVDFTARVLAQRLEGILKQPIIVENRGGASGNIGTQQVARAKPDGYTLLMTSSAFAVNPSIYGDDVVGYDPSKDFKAVAVASSQPNVIAVHGSTRIDSLEGLKTSLLANPGKFAFSNPGKGTTPYLTCENLFRVLWKADITNVPYKGGGPASSAVYSNETAVGCAGISGLSEFAKTGTIKILAVSAETRVSSSPEIPTLVELGYPDITDNTWSTIFAPAGTADHIVDKINNAVNQSIQDPSYLEAISKQGMTASIRDARQTQEYIDKEVTRWARIVDLTGAKEQ